MNTKLVHFQITGEVFTKIVRDLMLDEKPSQAWKIIINGLRDGYNLEQAAIAVLSGDKKFVGNELDGLLLEDDKDSEEYKKELKYIFAGRIRKDNRWWRPRAEVDNFGPEDMEHACRAAAGKVPTKYSSFNPSSMWRSSFIPGARVEYYAGPEERVFGVYSHDRIKGNYIIFEPVSEPPFWWPEYKNIEQALEDFLSLRGPLQIEGHTKYYGPSDYEPKARTEEERLFNSIAVKNILDKADQISLDQEKLEEEKRSKDWENTILDIKNKVLKQANGDFIELKHQDKIFSVPRAPFIHWALDHTGYSHLAPSWKPISPSGLKLAHDNPVHSDWVIGAGFNPSDAYDSDLKTAAFNKMFEIQEEYCDFECGVIVNAGEVYGVIGEDIVVLPDLSPNHLEKIKNATGIITENGGQLAHLAQIAREEEITIMRVIDAQKRFIHGMKVKLQPQVGLIIVEN